jgi:hypothetical protein
MTPKRTVPMTPMTPLSGTARLMGTEKQRMARSFFDTFHFRKALHNIVMAEYIP